MVMNENEHEDKIEMATKVLEMTAINKKINDYDAIGYSSVFRSSLGFARSVTAIPPLTIPLSLSLSRAEYHSNQT